MLTSAHGSFSLSTISREIKNSSSLICQTMVCLCDKQKACLFCILQEHSVANNRNLIVSNGAGSQTVKKLLLQLNHPIPIFIYNLVDRHRLAVLFCLREIPPRR